MDNYETRNWYLYLDPPMQDLMRQSIDLIHYERGNRKGRYADYSFIVFPAAKAYEGFLKKVFLDLGMITDAQYKGDHFRIGRSLSPNLPKRYRAGWVFGKLVRYCQGEILPQKMWDVWKRARNQIFHYFPDRHRQLSLPEAENLVHEVIAMMEETLSGCGLH